MNEFFDQYFDFHIMGEHFGEVFEGFLQNLLIFVVAGRPRPALGTDPGPAAPAAGQEVHADPRS